MRSFSADPASSSYIARIRPLLIGFADEVSGTLARLSAYGMALALLAILGIALCNALPDAMVAARSTGGGWSQVEHPARAFAVGQANLHDKTEVYEIFRHPAGGRKDTLRWIAADGKPVAELEIYRPGGELHEPSPVPGLVVAGLSAGLDRGGARELEAAGLTRESWLESEGKTADEFDTEIRRIVCTTNAIESVNARIRKAVRARGHFPTEQAALRCVYLAVMSLDPKGTGSKRWAMRWKAALQAFDITFDGRLTAGRR